MKKLKFDVKSIKKTGADNLTGTKEASLIVPTLTWKGALTRSFTAVKLRYLCLEHSDWLNRGA